MDRETKGKLRRIWFARSLVGLGVLVTLGFSIRQVQAVSTNTVTYRQVHEQLRLQEQERLRLQEQEQELLRKLELLPLNEKELLRKQEWERALLRLQEQELLRLQKRLQERLPLNEKELLLLRKLDLWRKQKQKQFQLQELLQKSNQAWLFLGLSVLSFAILLLLLFRQRNQASLTLTGQLFLPEECIADLEALHQRMKSQQQPLWFIQLRMLQEVVELLWAFHIHIRIENLWLPGKNDSIDE